MCAISCARTAQEALVGPGLGRARSSRCGRLAPQASRIATSPLMISSGQGRCRRDAASLAMAVWRLQHDAGRRPCAASAAPAPQAGRTGPCCPAPRALSRSTKWTMRVLRRLWRARRCRLRFFVATAARRAAGQASATPCAQSGCATRASGQARSTPGAPSQRRRPQRVPLGGRAAAATDDRVRGEQDDSGLDHRRRLSRLARSMTSVMRSSSSRATRPNRPCRGVPRPPAPETPERRCR